MTERKKIQNIMTVLFVLIIWVLDFEFVSDFELRASNFLSVILDVPDDKLACLRG